MTNITKLPASPRRPAGINPETLLADLLRNGDPIMRLHNTCNAKPIEVGPWDPIPQIEKAIAENSRMLREVPADNEVERLRCAVDAALAISTEASAKRHIGELIGAFPNSNPTSPEIFMRAFLEDILEAGIPDAILHTTCRELRRTMRFLPTIAEFLAVAENQRAHWQRVGRLQKRLPQVRQELQAALMKAEAASAEIRREIEAGNRDETGKLTQKGIERWGEKMSLLKAGLGSIARNERNEEGAP